MLKNLLFIGSLFLIIGCGGGSSTPVDTTDSIVTDPVNPNPEPIDNVAPVVTLNGEIDILIANGENYIEYGASAVDDVDGNLPVTITGAVDTNTANTYIVTYSAEDAAGNIGQTERYVTVYGDTPASSKTQIDALVLYSQDTETLYNGEENTRINHLFAVTNQIHSDSGTDTYFNLIESRMHSSIDDSSGSIDILNYVTDDNTVQGLRDLYSVDEVVVFRPYNYTIDDGLCGVAWINTPLVDTAAYAVVTIDCPSETTAHEIGHNLGLDHSHAQQGSSGIYPYSLGHGEDGSFVTVMAYPQAYNTDTVILAHSSPLLDCGTGPCGIDEGEIGEADAVKSIIQTKTAISNFR